MMIHYNFNKLTYKDDNNQTDNPELCTNFDTKVKPWIYFLFNPEFHTKLLYYAIRYNASSKLIINVII